MKITIMGCVKDEPEPIAELDVAALPRKGDMVSINGPAFGDGRGYDGSKHGESGTSVFEVETVVFEAFVDERGKGGTSIEVHVTHAAHETPPLSLRCVCKVPKYCAREPDECDDCGRKLSRDTAAAFHLQTRAALSNP